MFVFGDFRRNVRIWPKKDVVTDNLIFKLHYRLTFLFILVCTVIVSSRQFVREHINCISDHSVQRVINTFCFFSSTFTVVKYHNASSVVGSRVAYAGVGPHTPEDEVTRHAYYQWVPFVLFFQALLFYLPHFIWKNIENNRMSNIINSVKTSAIVVETEVTIRGEKFDSGATVKMREELLKNICLTRARFRLNKDWALGLVSCELLNALNIILQIHMVDSFLQGNFTDLGSRWLSDEDVLETVFPKVTKCTFHKFGPSGSIQTHDSLCVMALNIINEKIYIILWFWFMVLLVVTLLGLTWRVLTLLLHRRSGSFNRLVWGEVSPGPALKRREMEVIATKLSFSDWLFLYYLGRNMNGDMFRRTVTELATELSTPLLKLRESDRSNMANESFC